MVFYCVTIKEQYLNETFYRLSLWLNYFSFKTWTSVKQRWLKILINSDQDKSSSQQVSGDNGHVVFTIF